MRVVCGLHPSNLPSTLLINLIDSAACFRAIIVYVVVPFLVRLSDLFVCWTTSQLSDHAIHNASELRSTAGTIVITATLLLPL